MRKEERISVGVSYAEILRKARTDLMLKELGEESDAHKRKSCFLNLVETAKSICEVREKLQLQCCGFGYLAMDCEKKCGEEGHISYSYNC